MSMPQSTPEQLRLVFGDYADEVKEIEDYMSTLKRPPGDEAQDIFASRLEKCKEANAASLRSLEATLVELCGAQSICLLQFALKA
jgi:hypothetical protein